jgi:hypothetical protein
MTYMTYDGLHVLHAWPAAAAHAGPAAARRARARRRGGGVRDGATTSY